MIMVIGFLIFPVCSTASISSQEGEITVSSEGIIATSQWDSDSNISYTVQEEGTGNWVYEYSIKVDETRSINYIILQACESLKVSDLKNLSIEGDKIKVGWHQANNSNSGLPNDIYGIRIDIKSKYSVYEYHFSFESDRAPDMSLFYAEGDVFRGEKTYLLSNGELIPSPGCIPEISTAYLFIIGCLVFCYKR